MRLELDVRGLPALDRHLAGIERAVRDVRPAWDELADKFAAGNAARFASAAGWAPLARPTGRPPLQRTGALRASLTSRPLGVERLTGTSAVLGTNVPYSKFHIGGTSRMPKRNPLARLPEHDWAATIDRYVSRRDTRDPRRTDPRP